MLFGRYPEVPLAPNTQVPELLHFCMLCRYIVFDGQAGRVEYPDIAAEAEEDARCFVGKQSRIGPVCIYVSVPLRVKTI